MAIKLLDEKNMVDEVAEGVSIVEFGAAWCPPCRALLPVLEALSDLYPIKVGKVDIDDNLDLAQSQKIMNVPVLIVYQNGAEVERVIGFGGREKVEALFKKYS